MIWPNIYAGSHRSPWRFYKVKLAPQDQEYNSFPVDHLQPFWLLLCRFIQFFHTKISWETKCQVFGNGSRHILRKNEQIFCVCHSFDNNVCTILTVSRHNGHYLFMLVDNLLLILKSINTSVNFPLFCCSYFPVSLLSTVDHVYNAKLFYGF